VSDDHDEQDDFTGSELYEMDQADQYRLDAEDDMANTADADGEEA
jgi:hypothetical protein